MKKILMCAVAVAASFSVMAQNEHIHVFRSDAEKVTSVKGSEIQSITHEGSVATGFKAMKITKNNGDVTTIDMAVIDSVQTRLTNLPVFYVNLQDYPNWTELQGSKDNTHPATLRMEGNGMYSDVAEQTVEFRGRGNSTWGMAKKPYRFKMDNKASVCGLPKAKSFVLLANYIDCTLMRNTIAFWIANYLEIPFSNHAIPVRVIFNGIDKGAYLLTEKLGIGGGSVDIDEDKGMLFELDTNYDEDYKFKYKNNGYNLPVMVKDPDITDINLPEGYTVDQYFAAWQADFTEMADAVTANDPNADLSKYIDLEQMAKFFVVAVFSNNHEFEHPKSFYLHKEELGENAVYKFGPNWDYDWAFTFNGHEGAPANVPLVSSDGGGTGGKFVKSLFQNTAFRQIFKETWDKFIAEGYPQLRAFMDDYARLIEPQAIANGKMWPDDNSVSWRISRSSLEFRQNYQELEEWIETRINYCNSHANYGIHN